MDDLELPKESVGCAVRRGYNRGRRKHAMKIFRQSKFERTFPEIGPTIDVGILFLTFLAQRNYDMHVPYMFPVVKQKKKRNVSMVCAQKMMCAEVRKLAKVESGLSVLVRHENVKWRPSLDG